jgi:hypothetical protein
MTDLIERVDAAFADTPVLGDDEAADRAPSGPRAGGGKAPARPLAVLLAVALGGSAILLFAMASGHLHGTRATAGVVAALAEVALAVGVLTRPSRALFTVVAVVNVGVALLWLTFEGPVAVSTTTAAIGKVLAALAALVGVVLALRPALDAKWSSGTSVIGSLVPLGVVIVTLVGLFATTTARAATPAHSAGAANASTALAEATTVTVPGENSKTFASTLAGNASEQSENAKWVPLGAHDQAILTDQLFQAEQAAMRFPTVASAKAAGMILAGGMAPGVGAHYQIINGNLFKGLNPDGSINALYPASWIYASVADDAPVVGVMYEAFGDTPPSGFVGPNDHWHRHSDVCIQITGGKIAVPFAADQDVTPQECADVHGQFMQKTVWMVHAWVVPGWESPQGVFSHDNLHLYCPGNTDLTNAIGFCDRQS